MSVENRTYQTQEDLPCPVNDPQEFNSYLEMRQNEARLGLLVTNKVAELEAEEAISFMDFRMRLAMAG